MNPFRSNVGTLNEILFENRNQNYGAYVIRKSYGNTVFKSLAITAGIFILGFWGLSLLVNTKVEVPTDTGANVPPDVSTIYEVQKPKTKVIPVKHAASTPAVSKPETLNALGTKIIDSTEKAANTALNTNITPIGTNSLNTTGTLPGPNTSTLTGEPTNTLTTGNGEFTMAPDVAPFMPDWSKILKQNLSYPHEAIQNGISGKVVVNFIVDEEGKIIQTKILHHVAGGCDEEALRVIKLMPRWKPGMVNGKPVKVSFNQVITFQLN